MYTLNEQYDISCFISKYAENTPLNIMNEAAQTALTDKILDKMFVLYVYLFYSNLLVLINWLYRYMMHLCFLLIFQIVQNN